MCPPSARHGARLVAINIRPCFSDASERTQGDGDSVPVVTGGQSPSFLGFATFCAHIFFMPQFCRRATMSSLSFSLSTSMSASVGGSFEKGASSVLTLLVLALVLSIICWRLTSPGAPSLPDVPSLPRGMSKLKWTLLPSKLTLTAAFWPGSSVVTESTTA